MKRFHNHRVQDAPTYNIGDKVFLEHADLWSTRPSHKLNFKCFGLFKILQKVLDSAYRLELPDGWSVHSVFLMSCAIPQGHCYRPQTAATTTSGDGDWGGGRDWAHPEGEEDEVRSFWYSGRATTRVGTNGWRNSTSHMHKSLLRSSRTMKRREGNTAEDGQEGQQHRLCFPLYSSYSALELHFSEGGIVSWHITHDLP